MRPEIVTLTELMAVTSRIIEDCRQHMAEQEALIAYLTKTGESTEEAEKLLSIFADMEKRFLDYRSALEIEITKRGQ